MENASKALIFIGGILIAILIITVGIFMYENGKTVPAAKRTRDEKNAIDAFNSKFSRV